MALVSSITHQALQEPSTHAEVDCTYDIVTDDEGRKFLQLDTYGSKARQILGKRSHSLRLDPSAIAQLKQIIQQHGL